MRSPWRKEKRIPLLDSHHLTMPTNKNPYGSSRVIPSRAIADANTGDSSSDRYGIYTEAEHMDSSPYCSIKHKTAHRAWCLMFVGDDVPELEPARALSRFSGSLSFLSVPDHDGYDDDDEYETYPLQSRAVIKFTEHHEEHSQQYRQDLGKPV